ncbi:MAG: hypothetical protein II559_08845 [Muribaculaceae bacterium]|nr:hypothetical protein [Muribaculaceae bacterium]MBQ5409400.1 hypothetical protein [Muribaculaceae bacterium]
MADTIVIAKVIIKREKDNTSISIYKNKRASGVCSKLSLKGRLPTPPMSLTSGVVGLRALF